VSELLAALGRAGVRDVSDATVERAAYSSDASLYRVVPTAVAWPRHTDEVAAALEVCRTLQIPVTCRGAGTSIAGNAVGTGLVLDFSRHLNTILELDPQARRATVEPGVVHARLQRAAAPHGLRFGPDPSSHTRCTIGGMIGNNACGSRALAYGRMSDNVLALRALTAAGERLLLEGPEPHGHEELRKIVGAGLATIRTEFGRFGRQVSGYALENLLPEKRFDLRRLFVGSEGTLGVVTAATVRLVEEPGHRVLTVLGYPDMAAAADAVPAVLPYRPTACEGLDSRIVAAMSG
jgi:FAD/FMN-containing dehydrogenase